MITPVWERLLGLFRNKQGFFTLNGLNSKECVIFLHYAVKHPEFLSNISKDELNGILSKYPEFVCKIQNLNDINWNPEIPSDDEAPIIFRRNEINQNFENKIFDIYENGFDKMLIDLDNLDFIKVCGKNLLKIMNLSNYMCNDFKKIYRFFKGIDLYLERNEFIRKNLNCYLCLFDENILMMNVWYALDKCKTLESKSDLSKIVFERINNESFLQTCFDENPCNLYRYFLPYHELDEIPDKNNVKSRLFLALSRSKEMYEDYETYHNRKYKYFDKDNHNPLKCLACNPTPECFPYWNYINDCIICLDDLKNMGRTYQNDIKKIVQKLPHMVEQHNDSMVFQYFKNKKIE